MIDPRFKQGDRAKVRKPSETDDCETMALLDKYKGEKVIVISSYFSSYYNEYGYLVSLVKENASVALLEKDLI